jgi:dCMP deaminase
MSPERKQQLDEVLLKITEVIATMSFATRAKVGAILYKDDKIISMGWNGLPSGFPNDEIEIVNADGSLTTNPLVLHAESNAILKCSSDRGGSRDSTLYCTYSPCPDCTKLIIQAGIKRVVYRNDYRLSEGKVILEKAGIELVQLKKV